MSTGPLLKVVERGPYHGEAGAVRIEVEDLQVEIQVEDLHPRVQVEDLHPEGPGRESSPRRSRSRIFTQKVQVEELQAEVPDQDEDRTSSQRSSYLMVLMVLGLS
ncbi:MAG: hypothetical protein HY903_20010 [Deltaproteobacteria bacterium]|nr:hypothetical protein [Deltaproteobacteria bacterium]